jgi:hypothetical protein
VISRRGFFGTLAASLLLWRKGCVALPDKNPDMMSGLAHIKDGAMVITRKGNGRAMGLRISREALEDMAGTRFKS